MYTVDLTECTLWSWVYVKGVVGGIEPSRVVDLFYSRRRTWDLLKEVPQ